jgi:adenosylhomocysteine nucleosidase
LWKKPVISTDDSSKSRKNMRLGIISALAEEQQGLIEALRALPSTFHGMREYTAGNSGKSTLCAFYRV